MREPSSQRVVGVIPMAGAATRLAPLPCSKELLPVGLHREPTEMRGRPKAVSEYLLEQLRDAGVQRLYLVVRPDKLDIARYYGDGSRLGLNIAYLMMGAEYGPPFTVAQAIPFVGDATVLFGFPDTLVKPDDGFARLLARLNATDADVVLGLFRGATEQKIDVVERRADGGVLSLITKEEHPMRGETDIGYLSAVWRPSFSEFLATQTRSFARVVREREQASAPEWPMGAVFAAAIRAGLRVNSVLFDDARFLDVGTPDGFAAAPSFPGVWSGIESKL